MSQLSPQGWLFHIIHNGMNRLPEFRIFYNHTIYPELVRMENKRKRLLRLMLLSILLFIALSFVLFYLEFTAFTFLLLLPIGMYISYVSYSLRKFIKTFKPNVVNLILDFIDDDLNFGTLRYESQKFISKTEFAKSQIFDSKAHIYEGEDYISGEIGELPFEMCELKVRELSRVRNRYNYVFRGIFLKSHMKKQVFGTILILPEAFKQYLSKSIRSFNRKGGFRLDESQMDPEFSDYFDIYATRDAQPKFVLDKDMQRSIAKYRREIGKEIYLSFVDNNIYLAVTEPKDILEPYIFKSNINFPLIREFFEDIQLLLSIVQEFDSDSHAQHLN